MINVQISLIQITSYTKLTNNRDRNSLQNQILVLYLIQSNSYQLKSCISNVLYILTIATKESHSAKSIPILYCFIFYYFIVLMGLVDQPVWSLTTLLRRLLQGSLSCEYLYICKSRSLNEMLPRQAKSLSKKLTRIKFKFKKSYDASFGKHPNTA